MTKVYLIRHCESLANLQAIIAGRVDFDISEKGALQLEYLSERFQNIKLDAIYSSPLIRAYKTALAANKYPQAPIIQDERLIEINFGEIDGKPFSSMTEEQKYHWNKQPHLVTIKGGETVMEAGERFFGALMDIVKQNPDKTIAIAAHGGVYRSLFCMLRKLPWDKIIEVNYVDNTGVNLVHFHNDGSWEIVYENDTSHLPAKAAAVPISAWDNEEKS